VAAADKQAAATVAGAVRPPPPAMRVVRGPDGAVIGMEPVAPTTTD